MLRDRDLVDVITVGFAVGVALGVLVETVLFLARR